jgi:HD-like signal output (HDOD) protein
LKSKTTAPTDYIGQFRLTYAQAGQAALESLRETPAEVIISDMRLRDMDGVMLFERVKEEHPDVVRVMLCGQADNADIFNALPVSHQVLGQPLEAVTLLNVIERTCRLRTLLTDALLKRVGDIEKLPSLPTVYHELMDAVSRPDISTQRIARIVERDAAMAAKLLQLVNSACFGLSQHITGVDQAVVYLGLELIKNLALTVHVFSALERQAVRSGLSLELQQEHALITARVARQFLSSPVQARDAFTAALLHDIGKLVLAVCIPAKFKICVETCRSTGRPSHEVEAEILGVTHAEVGAYLLSLWGLPYPIVEAVAFHHNPGAAMEEKFDVPSAVSLADSLVNQCQGRPATDLSIHLESLKVKNKLSNWTTIAKEEYQQLTMQKV